MVSMTMKVAPRLPSLTFSDRVSAGVLGPTGAGAGAGVWAGTGVATTAGVAAAAGTAAGAEVVTATGVAAAAWVATAVFLLSTALAFTVALVPAVVAPAVVVLSACLDAWHPTSIVAATNMIGMMLRIIWQFNVNRCLSNSPLPRLTEPNLRIVVKCFRLLAHHAARP